MSLANLTTSGWVLFAFWLAAALEFLFLITRRNVNGYSVTWLAVTSVWLLWLVTP